MIFYFVFDSRKLSHQPQRPPTRTQGSAGSADHFVKKLLSSHSMISSVLPTKQESWNHASIAQCTTGAYRVVINTLSSEGRFVKWACYSCACGRALDSATSRTVRTGEYRMMQHGVETIGKERQFIKNCIRLQSGLMGYAGAEFEAIQCCRLWKNRFWHVHSI